MEQNVMVQSVNYRIMQMVYHRVCAAPIPQHAPFFRRTANADRHTTTDSSEPSGAASPMGNSVSANSRAAIYEHGMRTSTIDSALCMNERYDFWQAQK